MNRPAPRRGRPASRRSVDRGGNAGGENKQSARVGPSMVAALVNSTLSVRPGAAHAISCGLSDNGPRFATRAFRRSRRSPRPGGGQRSRRFFALIESDVHSRKRLGRSRIEARRPHRQAFVFRLGRVMAKRHGRAARAAPACLVRARYRPNAGAMMRTCACLGVDAAIIEPAGFRINDSRFRRAGMDYLDALTIKTHDSWAGFAAWRASRRRRLVLLTTKGSTPLWDFAFREGDIILVGRESAGVPEAVSASADNRLVIPIRPGLRSLNVGIAATIAITTARGGGG
jgi:tRNA (cytidine/uridine-2'-O-)-methyltransferase